MGAWVKRGVTPWEVSDLPLQTKCLHEQYCYFPKFLHFADVKVSFCRGSRAILGEFTVLRLFAAAADFCEHHRIQ